MNARRSSVLWLVVVAVMLGGLAVAPASARTSPPTDAASGGAYVALTPVRVLDTRDGTGSPASPVAADGSLALSVLGRGGVPAAGVAAIVLNVTATGAKGSGNITVYPAGADQPLTSNLDFVTGQTVADLVIAKVGLDGQIELANNSRGTVELVADVSGYYTAGTASAPAAFTALNPYRAMDTRIGTGVASGAVGPDSSIALTVTDGHAGRVPSSGVSEVAMTVTVVEAGTAGNLTVYPPGSEQPPASDVQFSANQTIANLLMVHVGDGGRVMFTNNSDATLDLVADVAGYFAAGSPIAAGTFGAIDNPARVLDSRIAIGAAGPVAPHATVHIDVTGRGSVVPASGMSAVALNLTITDASRAGNLVAYADGASEPATSNVNFPIASSVENLAVVIVGSDGDVALTNNSSGSVDLVAAITGYFLSASLPLPPISPGYYVRSLTGNAKHDTAVMATQACTDASSVVATGDETGRTVVLDFGSQTIAVPVAGGGVTQAGRRITYPDVVRAVRSYIASWHRCAPASPPVTIAVGTNSDGNWTQYPAAARARDWWRDVVRPSESALPAGFTVAGASDIEPEFTATPPELDAWIVKYTTSADHPLIEFGTVDGCPPTPGQSDVECSPVPVDGGPRYQAWDQEEAYNIAHGDAPGLIQVLPQIGSVNEAVQWQNVDITGEEVLGGTIDFIGVLNDHSADPAASLTVDQGWAYLYRQLSTDPGLTQPLPAATHLRVL